MTVAADERPALSQDRVLAWEEFYLRRRRVRHCFWCREVVPPGEQWGVTFDWLFGGQTVCAVCAESWSNHRARNGL